MIYTVLIESNNEVAYLPGTWEEYHKLTFNPETQIVCTIELDRLKGKSYQEKKKCIQNKAIEFSNNRFPGLSIYELSLIDNYFYKYGSRLGLLEEFKENAII